MILKILDYSRSKTFNLRVASTAKYLEFTVIENTFPLMRSSIPVLCHVCLLLLSYSIPLRQLLAALCWVQDWP